jgi:hypothetical protein
MDNVPSFVFSMLVLALVFLYDAYRDRKRAEVERALINQGRADAVVELRRLRAQGVNWLRQPMLAITLGVAAMVSAGILYLAGLGDRYGRADVWFVIFGVFAIAWGVAIALEKREPRS